MGTVPEALNSRRYIRTLERLVEGSEVLSSTEWDRRLGVCLDGEPARVLRQEESPAQLRRQGAYFTTRRLASKLVEGVPVDPASASVYCDPACGGGDLLIAVARSLPIGPTIPATLKLWSRRLAGCDISPEFVRLTKARLALLAAKRCRLRPSLRAEELASAFPRIEARDYLACGRGVRDANFVLMNPPFAYAQTPDGCPWATGRVNAAALFLEKAVRESREGTQVAAILPDVLRSGSRYERWRRSIRVMASIRGEHLLGLFDKWADVNVYQWDLVKKAPTQRTSGPSESSTPRNQGTVRARFAVHVGPVVPHRHNEVGPEHPYVHARSLEAWGECGRVPEQRRFKGRLFQPPFVAVRRTSRPSQKKRAVATIVLGQESVAVENHLIVLSPRDGSLETCRELMTRLKSGRTDRWINRRLCCRHLTIGVLADMPWWREP